MEFALGGNLVKQTIAIALGLVEDAQGTLQREMMSYPAIAGYVFHYAQSQSPSQQLRKKTVQLFSYVCVCV